MFDFDELEEKEVKLQPALQAEEADEVKKDCATCMRPRLGEKELAKVVELDAKPVECSKEAAPSAQPAQPPASERGCSCFNGVSKLWRR
mmetsp:Transcript_136400/g.323045  ORF Transcript_136400/g.323045 Transcript_136400/m.323045 type:complete len:89 (-) Transcript_136400:25-291(-)